MRIVLRHASCVLFSSLSIKHFPIFRHFDDFEKKIPRAEIEEIEQIIQESIAELDEKYIITICGSYRRGKPESGDIDILLTHPSYTSDTKDAKKHTTLLKSVVKHLEEKKLITDTISHGEFKFMVSLNSFFLENNFFIQ